MEALIRDAVPTDLDALEELEKECFSLPWTREQLQSELPDERHVFLTAELDGDVVGYVGMMCVLDEGYISNVAVSPRFRRQGIGRAGFAPVGRRRNYYERPREDAILMTLFFNKEEKER